MSAFVTELVDADSGGVALVWRIDRLDARFGSRAVHLYALLGTERVEVPADAFAVAIQGPYSLLYVRGVIGY